MKPALFLCVIAALALSGCSETKFADMLGTGKSSPDETMVRTGHNLSMPPDLQLRQPGAVTEDGNLTTAAAQPVSPAPGYETQAAAPAPGNLSPSAKRSQDFWASEMQQSTAAPDPSLTPEEQRKQSFWSSGTNNLFKTPGKRNPFWDADPNAPKTKPITRDEAFAKFGISKTKPDGTPKTDNELDQELKAAVLAEKRKANPDYGTIGNLGNIFSDG